MDATSFKARCGSAIRIAVLVEKTTFSGAAEGLHSSESVEHEKQSCELTSLSDDQGGKFILPEC
jgi:hypothetical protein